MATITGAAAGQLNVPVVATKDSSDAGGELTASPQRPAFDSPYDWPTPKKMTIATILSLAQLIAISTASFMAAALPTIAADVNMTDIETQMSFSIYMIGLGLGPFFLSPLSEVFGRKPVWLGGSIFFAITNAMCPIGRSKGVLITFRLLSALGASCGVALTGATLADMYHKEERGKALAVGNLLIFIGPAIGPILGGVISQHISWPWLFWIMSLAEGAVMLVGFFFIHETYAPVLLRRQAAAHKPTAHEIIIMVAKRCALPPRLSVQRPVIQVISILVAISFGIYALLLSVFATVFVNIYHQSPTSASLHYISIAAGAIAGSQIGGYVLDHLYARAKKHSGLDEGQPEFRLTNMWIGALIGIIGVIWMGWCVAALTHWILVDIGVFVFSAGSFWHSQAVLAYLLDEFTTDAASANAASRILSYLLAFALPLPAPIMFERLGYGWGGTLLALVWLAIAVPLMTLLHLRGPAVRAIGRRKDEN